MSLTFVLGGAGTGKSRYLYSKILEEAAAEPDRQYLVIVPEQSSMTTQKALTDLARAYAILNIDVLSFRRLTYRVFRELGEETEGILEDTGKNLLMRRVIAEHEEELSVLTGKVRRMGYVDEIKSLLTEFEEYCIDDEAFDGMIERAATPLLASKLKDLKLLQGYFAEKCADTYITAQGLMERMAKLCCDSELLRDAVVVFDCFTGFTPVQLRFLRSLLKTAREVYVTLTIDAAAISEVPPEEEDLFYITKNTYCTLKRLASQDRVEVRQNVVFQEPVRFGSHEELQFIQRHFLRPGAVRFAGKEPLSDVHLHSFQTMSEELIFAADTIRRLVRERVLRYRDFAVVAGNEAYLTLAGAIFTDRGIPVFADEKRTVALMPIVQFIRGLFAMIESDFAADSVISFLRCELCGYERERVDELENYLVRWNIRRRYQWEKPWREDTFEDIRTTLLGEADRLCGETAADFTHSLYACLCAFQVGERLRARAEKLAENGDPRRAKEYLMTYESVMKLFEKLCDILGAERMDREEYAEILYTGLDALSVGVIPTGLDQVMVGDLTRSRWTDSKVLFLVGAAQGYIPTGYNSSGLLSQMERAQILSGGTAIAPTDKTKALTSRLYLYTAFTAPSEALYLSYSRMAPDGSALKRSYILTELQRRMPALNEIFLSGADVGRAESVFDLERFVYLSVARCRLGEEVPGFGAALKLLGEYEGKKELFVERLTRAFAAQEEGLPDALARALYGSEIRGSVSRLETYAACAFCFFLRYGLKLHERETLSFEAVDYGTMLHKAMETFGRGLIENGMEEDAAAARQRAGSAFDEAAAVYDAQGLFDEPKNRFFLGMMRDTFLTAADQVLGQLKNEAFRIAEVESEFETWMKDDRTTMMLSGKIDRIDAYAADGRMYVRIVDYKTGSRELSLSDIYHGISLQLPVYLKEAVRRAEKKGGQVAPAGMYYYHIDDPLVKAEQDLEDEEIGEQMQKLLKLKGRDVTDTLYGVLAPFTEHKLLELAGGIAGGRIGASPYMDQNGKTPCEYCDYAGICGFDPDDAGYAYRVLRAMDEETFIRLCGERNDGEKLDGGSEESH